MAEASSSASCEIVRLNVGGRRLETTRQTLCRAADSMLARMFSDEWRAAAATGGEHFLDRDGTHFHIVLNFLRDGTQAALPDCAATLAQLLREAEYYQLDGLAESCRRRLSLPSRPIRAGEIVAWRRDAVSAYWRAFALALIQDGVELPFFFDRVGRKYQDKQTHAVCIACLAKFSLEQITVFDFRVRFDEWEAVRHHMLHMRGHVAAVVGQTCCLVQWGNSKRLHVPNTAILPADDLL